jgi:8-oxo-dGTP pyrophosphatase MutT (NUDIX family)
MGFWDRLRFWRPAQRSASIVVSQAKTLDADLQREIPKEILKGRDEGSLDKTPPYDPFGQTRLIPIELPPIPMGDWSDPAAVLGALQTASAGNLQLIGQLSWALLTDPKIYGPLQIRCKGIVGLPKEFHPADDSDEAKEIAEVCNAHFDEWFTASEQERFLRTLIVLGASPAQIIFQSLRPGERHRALDVNCWDVAASNLLWYWDGANRNFGRWIATTKSGVSEPVPGDGNWIFATLTAKQPWFEGLIQPLAIRYAARLSSLYRWTKFNDRSASPFFVISNAVGLNTAVIDTIRQQVESGNPILVLPVGKDGNKCEAAWVTVNTSTGSATFKMALDVYGTEIAIAILGQNLSTEVKGGSHAAARVHDSVRQDIIEADAKLLATVYREQILKPFVVQNFSTSRPELAPYIVYETKSAENLSEWARALAAAGQFLGAVRDDTEMQALIDRSALLDKLAVPIKKQPGEQKGQIERRRGAPQHRKPPPIARAWAKDAAPDLHRVARVVILDEADRLLMGRRRDTGRWCVPGGHAETGESMAGAAIREALQEAGMLAESAEPIGKVTLETNEGPVAVFTFRCTAHGNPTSENDPDNEFDQLAWFARSNLPPLQYERDCSLEALGWLGRVIDAASRRRT